MNESCKEKSGSDPVNNPQHYTTGGIECIEAIEAAGFLPGFCLGNAMKYIWRYQHKGTPLEDLKKARWYLDRYIKHLEATDERPHGSTGP